MSLTLFIALAYYFFLRGYQESDKRRSSYLFVTVFMALGFLPGGVHVRIAARGLARRGHTHIPALKAGSQASEKSYYG